VIRDRRAQETPRLVLDLGSISFDKADDKVSRPGGIPEGMWIHEMVRTLPNVGPGKAFGVEFVVSATVDGVESEMAGGEFIPVLAPQQKHKFRTLFSTQCCRAAAWARVCGVSRDDLDGVTRYACNGA
jgi:hypothetical protein